jgi:hypothetical protein
MTTRDSIRRDPRDPIIGGRGDPIIVRKVTPRSHNSDPEHCLFQNNRLYSEHSTTIFSALYVYGSLFATRPPRLGAGCLPVPHRRHWENVGFTAMCRKKLFPNPTPSREPLVLDRMVVILGEATSNYVSCSLVPSQ